MSIMTRVISFLCVCSFALSAHAMVDAMGNYVGDYEEESSAAPTQITRPGIAASGGQSCLSDATQQVNECQQISKAAIEFCRKQTQVQKPNLTPPRPASTATAIAIFQQAASQYRQAISEAKRLCEDSFGRCAQACDDSALRQCRFAPQSPETHALVALQGKITNAARACTAELKHMKNSVNEANAAIAKMESGAQSVQKEMSATPDARVDNSGTASDWAISGGATGGTAGGTNAGGNSARTANADGTPGTDGSTGSFPDTGLDTGSDSGSAPSPNKNAEKNAGVMEGLAGLAGQFLNPAATNAAYQNPAELAGDHCSRPENMNDPICLCRGGGISLPQCQPGQMNSNSKMTFDQIASGVGGAKLQKPNGKTANGDTLQFPGNGPEGLTMGIGKPEAGTAAAPSGYGGGGSGLNTNKLKPSAPDEAPAQGSSLSANILVAGKVGGSGYSGGFRNNGLSAPRNPEGLPGYNLGLPKQQERPNLQAFLPQGQPPGSRAQITGTASFASTANSDGSNGPICAVHPKSMEIWKPMNSRYQSLNHTFIP